MTDADVFIGLSGPGTITLSARDLRLMAPDPIVFAMANPTPEIHPLIAGRVATVGHGDGTQRLPEPDQQRALLPRTVPRTVGRPRQRCRRLGQTRCLPGDSRHRHRRRAIGDAHHPLTARPPGRAGRCAGRGTDCGGGRSLTIMSDPRISATAAAVAALDPVDDREARSQIEILDGLDSLDDPFDEHAGQTHVTGSALIATPEGIILLKHKRLGIWLQPWGPRRRRGVAVRGRRPGGEGGDGSGRQPSLLRTTVTARGRPRRRAGTPPPRPALRADRSEGAAEPRAG